MCYRERRKEKNKVKEIELLAPAGSFEKAKIAFLYGADAVYCGTASLSLRSRAAIDDEDLIKTIEYAHKLGKKVYVAMNIYAFDTDYEEIKQMCKKLEEVKPDGIIAADPGVISTILKYAPSVPVNVSTQSNLVSLEACKFWYNQGCKRMIMAREMDKNQLKYIMENKPEGMEIEIFIHGAICFSYSGRCFLSDFLCGRSANYGSCAQSCRWSYNVYLEEKNNPGNLMPVEMDEHGTSILFPAITMGAHVSAVPNHQVGRVTALETRYAVAAAGNLGYELDFQKLSQEEMEVIKKKIAEYKQLRRTIQFGKYYRLANPFEENQASWNFVSEDGTQIIFVHVQVLARAAYRIPVLRLRGLEPKSDYRNIETGEIFGGDELMYGGITIPRVRQDFSSTMIVFEKVPKE